MMSAAVALASINSALANFGLSQLGYATAGARSASSRPDWTMVGTIRLDKGRQWIEYIQKLFSGGKVETTTRRRRATIQRLEVRLRARALAAWRSYVSLSVHPRIKKSLCFGLLCFTL